MPLAPIAVSALALLAERAMHPYEMFQLILDRHEERVVRVSAGTLYRAVDRLTREGYAAVLGTGREGNHPERTTYEITPLGQEALVARVRELLREPVQELPHFVLALSEARTLQRSQVIDDLAAHARALDADIAGLDILVASAREGGIMEVYYLESTYLRAMADAHRTWLRCFIARLEADEVPWPGPSS